MEVKVLNFFPNKETSGALVGRGDVQVSDVLILRGVSLFNGKKNTFFISPPRRKDAKGDNWFDVGFSFVYTDGKMSVKSKSLYEEVLNALLKAAKDNSSSGGTNVKTTEDGF